MTRTTPPPISHLTRPTTKETSDMYQYKVLTERDKRFAGGFDHDIVESTLNSYASEGWRLVEAVLTANLMKTAKAEIMMILERTAPEG